MASFKKRRTRSNNKEHKTSRSFDVSTMKSLRLRRRNMRRRCSMTTKDTKSYFTKRKSKKSASDRRSLSCICCKKSNIKNLRLSTICKRKKRTKTVRILNCRSTK
jgi:ribosomal protein L30/L7E